MHANMQYALQHVFNLNPVRAKLGVRVPSIFPVRLHPALRSSLALARSLLFMSWIFSSSLLRYIVGSFLLIIIIIPERGTIACFLASDDHKMHVHDLVALLPG